MDLLDHLAILVDFIHLLVAMAEEPLKFASTLTVRLGDDSKAEG